MRNMKIIINFFLTICSFYSAIFSSYKSMFDPTSPSADASAVAGESANNTTTSSYASPYAPVTYRPLTSTPSSSSIFNVPGSASLNSLDDPQQRRADFSAYPGTSPPFSAAQDPLAASSFM